MQTIVFARRLYRHMAPGQTQWFVNLWFWCILHRSRVNWMSWGQHTDLFLITYSLCTNVDTSIKLAQHPQLIIRLRFFHILFIYKCCYKSGYKSRYKSCFKCYKCCYKTCYIRCYKYSTNVTKIVTKIVRKVTNVHTYFR